MGAGLEPVPDLSWPFVLHCICTTCSFGVQLLQILPLKARVMLSSACATI